MDGLGRNHSLPTALADLVDNSVDAGATDTLIRIVRNAGRLCSLYVVDNGSGIAAEAIDDAMTLGGHRKYRPGDLGRFGIGLKAASFSQARRLTLLSRNQRGQAVGRQWELGPHQSGFLCGVVPEHFAAGELAREWNLPQGAGQTVVRWDEVTGFPATDDPARVEEYISRTLVEIRQHLGLVMHRLLAARRLKIWIEVEEAETGECGSRFEISPLDPFGYMRSGKSGWPKNLVGQADGLTLSMRCHIWPGRSQLPEFNLPGGADSRQGLYFYRNDRLLHAGGWEGIHAGDRRLRLARVEIDIEDDTIGLFRMNPEKSKVSAGPKFSYLCEEARAEDSTTLANYLQAAETAFRDSRRRKMQRKRMIAPGRGLAPYLKKAIEREIPILENEDSIDIRWTPFANEFFFRVDRENRTLWLNDRYRAALLGGRRGQLNDMPVLKALLYILMEDLFQGEYLGPKDKDNLEIWQELLTVAARGEIS
ncbi:histidine kinase/DNA gyrase B/HSP90-like ATPase [Streptomyces sp. PsTaAH-137]|nr:ATP-binding protein [Streptomyces sp. SID8367]RAJ82824.1 histidine kinase/DNA gyrase B/HSP90-like ATPase [Streptomyces sp. PsTaAH-137]